MTRTRVVLSTFPPATGWDTVELLGVLLARCLGAELVRVPHGRSGSTARRFASLLPRRPRGLDVTIVVAPQPVHLYAALDARHLLTGSSLVAGWVIDSFLTDRIPRAARRGGHFDHFFITDAELTDTWASLTGVTTSWLPFGSDVLDRGSSSPDREVDLQRVGRQPWGWDDDDHTTQVLEAAGLAYRGRPPFGPDAAGNQSGLLAAMAGARFTLSFTNRLSPAAYTHPTHEYLTGRWTDALASGAVVAGVPPSCRSTTELLWPEATLALPHTGPGDALDTLRESVARWSPELARLNHLRALQRLDWRWRFADLVDTLALSRPPQLQSELDRLRRVIAQRVR